MVRHVLSKLVEVELIHSQDPRTVYTRVIEFTYKTYTQYILQWFIEVIKKVPFTPHNQIHIM